MGHCKLEAGERGSRWLSLWEDLTFVLCIWTVIKTCVLVLRLVPLVSEQ